MVLLRTVPALAINLPRHRARKKHIKQVCAACHLTPRFIRAVDGQALKACNARERLRRGVLRLSWTSSSGQRLSGRIRLSKKLLTMRRKQLLDPWSVYGCARSHAVAARAALRLFDQNHRAVIVLEDDASLNTAMSTAKIRGRITQALQFLNKNYPSWGILMLGGERMDGWATHTQHKVVPGAAHLGLRYAERIFQSHAFVLGSREAAACFLRKLEHTWLVADGALAATQLELRFGCFFLEEQPLPQGNLGSSLLCTHTNPGGQRGWRHAWSPAAKAAPTKANTTKPVPPRQLQTAKSQAGSSGGQRHAGNGSNEASIRRKVNWLLKNKPSCDQAKAHGVSYVLWHRVLHGNKRGANPKKPRVPTPGKSTNLLLNPGILNPRKTPDRHRT